MRSYELASSAYAIGLLAAPHIKRTSRSLRPLWMDTTLRHLMTQYPPEGSRKSVFNFILL